MSSLAVVLVIVVAVIHVGFAALEIFGWNSPKVHTKLFGFDELEAKKAKPIVANAGFYNGFLAAGLIWSVLPPADLDVTSFFLVWALSAGVFGALTLRKPLVFVLQGLPALLALVVAWI